MLDDAWFFLRDNGLPEEACDPYTHCPHPEVSSCKAPTPPPSGHCVFKNDTSLDVSRTIIAGIWAAFFQECQQ